MQKSTFVIEYIASASMGEQENTNIQSDHDVFRQHVGIDLLRRMFNSKIIHLSFLNIEALFCFSSVKSIMPASKYKEQMPCVP